MVVDNFKIENFEKSLNYVRNIYLIEAWYRSVYKSDDLFLSISYRIFIRYRFRFK